MEDPDIPPGDGRPAERGCTLIEVLVAIALLTIGLIGVAGALSVQTGGVVPGISSGHAAVTRGLYITTAAALAQERLEQVKRLTYTLTTDQLSSSPPSGFSDEDYGSISGYPNFSRQVRVSSSTPAANMKTITVTVLFRLPTATGRNDESIAISTILAARP